VTEKIRFYFDPACPWAWRSSIWMREVATVRDLAIEWRLFSLKIANAPDDDPLSDKRQRTTPALRTLALVAREAGNDGVDELYRGIGARVHDGDEKPTAEVVGAALADAGLDPGLVERALGDESTARDVRADHEAAVAEVGAFGVPTIILPSGAGIFGPVVSLAPRGEAAGELWDRVRYLIELEGFYELKRDRTARPGSV
jgi:2-hydroxychromene-2-carboxylate isomerase